MQWINGEHVLYSEFLTLKKAHLDSVKKPGVQHHSTNPTAAQIFSQIRILKIVDKLLRIMMGWD